MDADCGAGAYVQAGEDVRLSEAPDRVRQQGCVQGSQDYPCDDSSF